MAKKTKQEKIKASQRRINQNVRIQITQPVSEDSQKNTVTSEEQLIRNYFLKDFRKSMILISTILIVELLLYQANVHGFLKVFSSH